MSGQGISLSETMERTTLLEYWVTLANYRDDGTVRAAVLQSHLGLSQLTRRGGHNLGLRTDGARRRSGCQGMLRQVAAVLQQHLGQEVLGLAVR